MKKVITVLLAVFTLFAFTACGKASLVGTFKTKYDLTSVVKDIIISTEIKSVPDQAFVVDIIYTFNEDGTYTVTVTDAAAEKAFEGLFGAVKQQLLDYFSEYVESAGYEGGLEAYLENNGYTMDDFVENLKEQTRENISMDSFQSSLNSEGKWKLEEDKLYMTVEGEEDFNDSEYDVVKADGDNYIFEKHVGSTNASGLYPLELIRQE